MDAGGKRLRRTSVSRRGGTAHGRLIGLALGVLLACGLTAVRVPRRGFVTVDLGAMYLQIHELATAGVAELPVGPLLAPIAHQHFPWRLSETPPGPVDDWRTLAGGWFVPVQGRWVIIYPIGFAWICALLYRLVGDWGPTLVPLASGAVATWATGMLAVRLGVRRPLWPAAVVGVASPLTLYSVLVWGHAPAVAACAVGFLLLTGGQVQPAPTAWRTAAAGAAFGLAAACRNEGLLMAALVAALVWVCGPRPALRHGVAFLASVLLVLSGPLAYNHATFGTWLDPTQAARAGLSAGTPAQPAPPALERLAVKGARAMQTFGECLLRSDNLAPRAQAIVSGALLVALAAVALGLWIGAPRNATLARGGLLLAGATAGLYLLFAMLVRPQQVPSLLLCAPALLPGVAALLAPRLWWRDARLLGLAAILFLLGCALRGSPGWQWGARYMLLALPVLAVLSARALEQLEVTAGSARSTRLHMLVLFGVGCGMTLVGWRDLYSEQHFRAEEQAVLRDIGAPVVAFDHWWFSWENAPLVLERELMFVSDPTDLAALLDRLPAGGPVPVGRVALVTRVAVPELARYAQAAASRGWRVSGRWDAGLPFGHEWHALCLSRGL